ncbi:chemotaxis protein [Photobacterium aquae]|uniref:Chemotaxis protein n=1 Tax=Photobacterium aquae TaxID=1195763 RepID=A0A0J1GYP9_9GAMM|nr:methyl-accepting chemotaxis protein [Photobacterium aquae]KLV04761.1 chemotaxis protein [Photobacterium aquae]
MKTTKKPSVIRRMYIGFAILLMLFVTTLAITLNGTSTIHQQLQEVTARALPLVSLSNQTSVKLLAADKVFKDYLTSQNPERMRAYTNQFAQSQVEFNQALERLITASEGNANLTSQLAALKALEQRYFAEAEQAMTNYRNQLEAQAERQKATRRFQKLHGELDGKMKNFVNEQDSISVKMIAKNYFIKLEQTEAITSDALATEDMAIIDKAVRDNKRYVNHLNNAYRSLSAMMPQLKSVFAETIEQYSRDIGKSGGVLDNHARYISARNKLYQNITTLAREIDEATKHLNSFNDQANQLMNQAIVTADNTYQRGLNNAIMMGSVAILFALAIGWNLSRSVRNPLNAVLKTLESLARGDMTQRSPSSKFSEFNTLAVDINTLADKLQEILGKLSEASQGLTSVAAENHTTTSQAKQRLNEQRQQTASVATAMTEMEQSVTDVSNSAQHTMARVQNVEKASNTGREVMSRNINTTHQLAERLDESVQAVSNLQSMSSNIGSILDVIRNIADQTNLLALNAAIEAARAGDQGRGFAVVADEVRILAKRTTDSTSEIEEMIQSLQSRSGQAVAVMQTCVTEMENSVALASDANSAMEEIQAIILDISQMSTQIAQAAEEQRSTTTEIARTLEDISHIADTNYAAMEEVSDASTKLDTLAQQQNDLVQQFKL